MHELLFETIETAAIAIQKKEISPVELTKITLAQIHKYEPALNAFITVMEEEALEQARQLEKDSDKQQMRSPLYGIPISVKDIIQTKGAKTTNGSKIFDTFIPNEDATVIKKLKDAGAIIIGKANLHEFAMGATTENPHYGSAKNPWDLSVIPGGSSGGSAVTTATGMAFASVGTDTAGSVRLPAAMCGTVGFKPTYGLVSRHGCFPFSWSLDHIGPMTRTVRDAAIMLEYMKGFDANDPASVKRTDSVLFTTLSDLKGVRLGLNEAYLTEGMDAGVKQVFDAALKQLEALGAEIVHIDLPFIDEALQALKSIAQSEALTVHAPLLKKYKHVYGDDLKYRFDFGSEISAATYLKAQQIRHIFVEKTLNQMIGIDALVGPTNVQPPFQRDTMVPDMAISNMFTLGKTPLANILGFPSLSVACGFTDNKLPVGLQFIGKPFHDKRVLQIGDTYERSVPWSKKLKTNTNYHAINQNKSI